MTRAAALLLLVAISASSSRGEEPRRPIANPSIDMQGYLRTASEAAAYREGRRVTEEEFVAMSREPGTIVLDARSGEKYAELHVKDAINLSFPDIAVASLQSLIPDKSTRILIYCNNNFSGAEGPFPTKIPTASLNLSTFIALYSYGYRNIWELGPKIDLAASKIPFERGGEAGQRSEVRGQSGR